MYWFQTAILVIILFFVFTWMIGGKPRRLPPGPWGLPLLGYSPFLGSMPYITMAKLGKRYGGIFTLPLFHQKIVVLSDWTSIKEALVKQSHIFSGRPVTPIVEKCLDNADISLSDDIGWRERRNLLLHHLKNFIFAKKLVEDVVMEETNKLLELLQLQNQQPVNIRKQLTICILNIVWTFVGSKRFTYSDSRMMELIDAAEIIVKELENHNVTHFVPALCHLPGRHFQKFLQANEKLNTFLDEEIEAHISTFQESHIRDFIDEYLAEIKKHQEQKSPFQTFAYQKKHLRGAVWDLFLAGIDTTTTTILWGLLYMVTWPEIQRKVQHEMDHIIGRARQPMTKDMNVLPYTMAVLLEIQRFSTILPLSLTHFTRATTTLCGYTIPKSTVIFENIWAVHQDPELWGDPEVFRPERFLNAKGQAQKPEYLIPFSVGGRMCPGEHLARIQVFVIFACLLHSFSFSMAAGEKSSFITNEKSGLTRKPPTFLLMIQQRCVTEHNPVPQG